MTRSRSWGERSSLGLVLTSNAAYPRGHPRTLGRAVKALDAYLGEHAGDRDLLNQIAWLPAPRS